jgi:cysteinyl-tRNA synthetase
MALSILMSLSSMRPIIMFLSGRNIEDMLANTRDLDGQWTKEIHKILHFGSRTTAYMRWPSPWSEGFPGWHLECTA